MRKFVYAAAAMAALALVVTAVTPGHADDKMKKASARVHHIAMHVDQNDKAVMNLVLNNVENLMDAYQEKGETVEIEVVAYGPGLIMLRDDKSPVKGRLATIRKRAFPSKVTYSACGNTKAKMEKKEGHPVKIVSEARVVPGGVVRLTELQEQGWAYIKP